MRYCANCGIESKDSWKHCPSCGSALPKIAKVSEENIRTINQEVSREAISREESQSQEPSIESEQLDSETTNIDALNVPLESGRDSYKALKIFSVSIVVILLLLLVPSFNQKNNTEVDDPVCQTDASILASSSECKSPQQVAEEVKKKEIQDAKDSFFENVISYRNENCKPSIKRPGPEFSDKMAEMNPNVNSDVVDLAIRIRTNPAEYLDWGNEVDRALLISAAYQYKLSELYWEIFDLWRSEMSSYKAKFNSYFSKSDAISRRLCYSDEPTNSQVEYSSKAYAQLSDGWYDFMIWWNKANDRELELSQELDQWTEDNKPKCQEYETNNPNYNIVKCTNLP